MTTDNISLWKNRLQNLTDLQVPTDYPRPLSARTIEEVQTFDLSEQTLMSLVQFSMTSARPTAFSVILAAFSVLLQRYTGDEEFAIGTSSPSGNPLLLRLHVDPTTTLNNVIEMVTKVEQEALSQEVPFDQLSEAVYEGTDPESRRPLCRVRFYNQIDQPSEQHLANTSATSDLTVFISSPEPTASLRSSVLRPVSISIVYNQILFTPKRIQYIFSQLATVIDTAIKSQELPVGQIPLSDAGLPGSPLPDPTTDLHWSQWRGAITDIFSANAQKHPDRTCIVESSDDAGITTYNYQQIHYASNTVAHYLIANGIQREDVVMIYAYRGVDLVVAIMGVLKAGATFSVIDPAYPPTRQEIYLSVAKPRGLIVLQEAGKIADSVRQYIKKEQDIICEIPNLKLGKDGRLSGSLENETDLLDSVRQKESQATGVVIGPDSIGTLSFTSGSTGIPKGVRGRHFSLTHFYPWMAETFGLSEKDKFTMLSGIAHDPIQRDIFTPLFLGAELHIPTSEDIGIPGRLAEWMNNSQVTVTHLTPAMGQLLSSHAQVEIPSLINAFFVGDILTKRDAARIQKYAPNVAVINMYGTTETQRSVSHFIVPARSSHPAFLSIQKEVIAAGKGMVNVQLLVVNRQDRTKMCGVGEIGEIYVRAPGLSEGYLRLPEATAEKFIPNWFVAEPLKDDGQDESCVEGDAWKEFYLGKRDRMYRSGDLGRYRPDGNVECTGRADDQVKIRGFRIELGEIDTHLSQHPYVRENVTLVRRDKNEEQTLVAYFVPNLTAADAEFASATEEEDDDHDTNDIRSSHHFRRLIKHIRDYLKQKLPTYAIPAVFVPLVRMPLTPNGKVDKNALPFPDTAQFNKAAPVSNTTTTLPEMTPNEATIHAIWKNLLPSSDPVIGVNENFFDIGGHSLIATRLIFEIRQTFQVDAPLGLVYAEPTIAGLAREVDKLQNGHIMNERDIEQHKEQQAEKKEEVDYAADLEPLAKEFLQTSYPSLAAHGEGRTFVLTGSTGFLGAFILDKLLGYADTKKVICVVRAKDAAGAFERVKKAAVDHLVWKDDWESRIDAVCGDLASDRLGLSDEDWNRCISSADAVVHNGALVHWVYPYQQLRGPNVIGTLWAMRLASEHHQKSFHFVSSTSVLDTPVYLESGALVSEDNNLEDSRVGLENGYGQSKWVSEKLILEARKRGMPATIIRPGYILGDSRSGVTNTDDFIWRLMKGCVELGFLPAMSNDINCCSVDYVASVVAGAAYHDQESTERGVLQVTHPAGFTYNSMFGSLLTYGYQSQQTEYIDWRNKLMEYTLKSQDHSLFPLLHFVLDDLPTSTKSAQLDDTNTQAILALDGVKQPLMGDELLGLYLAYLVKVGYMPSPAPGYRALPDLKAEVTLLARSGAKH
ncbi:L-aminoadipate-semialdehyde dehydrogenase [Gilbertella persicaria]|uniref:L-aminoadipate-semialdehyde dehydrogenase n=1 Tax=Gilbertella persicaria TaxID=101096 RepID=UPI0022206DB4|nr:L-aminoadipate-semialdehyde dehydrogenase [Gilbertella persicaria]KAI8081813.1 L-aminoadipate-semialdehyde dehydrogenase [Gilbertella persicaria]